MNCLINLYVNMLNEKYRKYEFIYVLNLKYSNLNMKLITFLLSKRDK